ncbi:hypothetical protein [Pseudomonas brassicacearum]|uniref:hypothetical protein n=1 Tax=Pseudomonas brassicacearum TaxID=930166 RepID=UPI000A4E15BF|nr:hypothetical protein [Pseudomonas brassicacearum]
MSYVFSESEKNRILEAVSLSSGLLFQAGGSVPYTAVQGDPEANCADVYQVIYDVISEKLSDTSGYDDNTISDLKSARLWFSVAIEANGGTGPYSTLIRDYTLTQGELRLGREFSEGELQGASNQVAANVVNGLLLGDVSGDLAPWTVPSITQIATLDATAVQQVLFRDALSPTDTAVTANSAWSGTLAFSWLGGVAPYETWRLVSSGDAASPSQAVANTMDDYKNVLFAIESWGAAVKGGIAEFGEDWLLRRLDLVWNISAKQFRVMIDTGNYLPFVQNLVKGTPLENTINIIQSYGVEPFFDMLKRAYTGSVSDVASTDFIASAYEFFSSISAEEANSLTVKSLAEYGDWKSQAAEDGPVGIAIRNSLKFFSAVVVERSDGFPGRGLELYDQSTGVGSITSQWLADREAMFARILSRNSTEFFNGNTIQQFSYLDIETGQQAPMATGTGNPLVIFASGLGSNFSGGTKGDHLYGGLGNDIIDGLGGNDYIEGGEGDDKLSGSSGTDSIYGMLGSDDITGGSGNDILEGGHGADIYRFSSGDGHDRISDLDARGALIINGSAVTGTSAKAIAENTWLDEVTGIRYVLSAGNSSQTLTIYYGDDDYVVIDDYLTGHLGIVLEEFQEPEVPVASLATIAGDLAPIDVDPNTAGVQYEYDSIGNVVVNPNIVELDREDFLNDSVNDDVIYGHGGDDYIGMSRGGNDYLDGGRGEDKIFGGSGIDTVIGGEGSDIAFAYAGNDLLYGDQKQSSTDASAIEHSAGLRGDWLDAGDGNDHVIGSTNNDLLLGGQGDDLLTGGAGDDALLGDAEKSRTTDQWGFHTERNEKSGTLIVEGASYSQSIDGGDDIINGGYGNDFISGGKGKDLLEGEDGDDLISGDAGNDIIYGGAGTDLLVGDNDIKYVPGNQHGNDFIDGGEGNDYIYGYGGNDVLLGGTGDDTIHGDGGDGSLEEQYHGSDHIEGGAGADRIYGGGADDVISGGAGDDLLYGDFESQLSQGDDIIDGGSGSDFIIGAGGSDTIMAGDDNDTVFGDGDNVSINLAGDDFIDAGRGDDTVHGGLGSDTIFGGEGDDILAGDDGKNINIALHGNDFIDGGSGNDIIDAMGGDDVIYGGSGSDEINGGAGDNYIEGGLGNDVLGAGLGGDVYAFNNGDGVDVVRDEGGSNIFVFGNSFSQYSVAAQQASSGLLSLAFGTDTIYFQDYQKLYHSVFEFSDISLSFSEMMLLVKDSLVLNSADSYGTAVGGGGNDTLNSGAGDDSIFGQSGDDSLSGGDGNDTYYFNADDGNDIIIDAKSDALGVRSSNVIEFGQGIARDSVTFSSVYVGSGDIALKAVYSGGSIIIVGGITGAISSFTFQDGSELSLTEVMASLPGMDLIQNDTSGGILFGTDNDDRVYGSVGVDEVYGGGGNDKIEAGDQNDLIYGEAGNDSLYGGQGDDHLDGGAGDDKLYGGDGDDTLNGSDGDDYLLGGRGDDNLAGGTGHDTYIFQLGMKHDIVVDEASDRNTIKIDSSVDPKNLVYSRDGDDLIIENANLDDSLTVKDYYNNIGKWDVTVSDQTVSLNEYISQSGSTDTAGYEYYEQAFKSRVLSALSLQLLDSGYSLESDGTLRHNYTYNYAYQYTSDTFIVSHKFVEGDVSETPYWVRDSNIQGVITSNVIESTTVDQETRIVAAANLSNAGQLGAPVFYSAREGSGFSYNLNDIIVEKFDSDGELIGFYVYPDATSTDRVYKDFIYTNTVSDTQHLIVNGSDAGGSLYITDANIFHGGLGDDLVTSVDDPTRIMHGLHQGVAISGGGGNDTLRGYWGDDLLAGGTGRNILEGGDGSDTYVVDSDTGSDLINDFSIPIYQTSEVPPFTSWTYVDPTGGASDIVVLPDGVSLSDLVGSWGTVVAEGVDYRFIGGKNIDRETIKQWKDGVGLTSLQLFNTLNLSWGEDKNLNIVIPHEDGANGDGVEYFRLSDGTQISFSDLVSHLGLTPNPTDVQDIIIDTIDSIVSPHVAISGGIGNDTIKGNGELRGWEGNDTLVGGFSSDTLIGGSGSDILRGADGDDIIQGGRGDDVLDGGDGNDRYIYDFEGSDVIDSNINGYDGVVIKNSWDLSELSYHRDGNDLLVLSSGDLRTQLRIKNQFGSAEAVVDFIEAGATGSSISSEEIELLLSPLPVNIHDNFISDYRDGWSGNNYLYGGGGADQLSITEGFSMLDGGSGNDTYSYMGGSVIIRDDDGVDSFSVMNGASLEEIKQSMSRSENDLILDFSSSYGGNVVFQNYFLDTKHQIESLSDSYGQTITSVEVHQVLNVAPPVDSFYNKVVDEVARDGILSGTDANDLLQGFNGDDTLDGGAGVDRLEGGWGNDSLTGGVGNDFLIGGRGDDLYHFSNGHGQDVVDNQGGGNDAAVFQGLTIAGFLQSVQADTNDLKVSWGGNGDQVTFLNWLDGGDNMVNQFRLDDGNLSAEDIRAHLNIPMTTGYVSPVYSDEPDVNNFSTISDESGDSSYITGSSGDDLLIGGAGDDVIYGGYGNDYLIGGDGSDKYAMDKNSGRDVIDNHSNDSDFDILEVEGELSQLWLSRSDDNLVITLLDSDAEMTVKNWYSDVSSRLDGISVSASQSSFFEASQVDSLVEAMAVFGVPTSGEIKLSISQRGYVDQLLGVGGTTPGGSGGGQVS